MSKKDIGTYYVSLPKGDHSLFLSLVCILIGGCQDKWLRLFRAWMRNAIAQHDATEVELRKLKDLVRNEGWRTKCNAMRQL